ncbi:MAG: type II toxin-antitoxin system HicB family antitoxin [Planctomycetia bacterium]|nr:type II toxin-antitoxin system HicB family antitoxin [Planctomycetia bacterium]
MKNGKRRLSYTVVLSRETDGRIIAEVPGVPGCLVYGRTAKEAVRRATSALNFHLESLRELGLPAPKQVAPVAVQVQVAG